MWRPRNAAVALSFSLAILLTIPHAALAQHAPGGRMRGPIGGHIGGHVGRAGAFMRPGRLMGVPRGTVDPRVRPFHRGFADRGFHGRFRSRFGFPHHRGFHHSGFFFFTGVGFFGGFPFFDGFAVFDGFPRHRVGLFRLPHRHFGFSGFPHGSFGFFGHRTIPVGAALGFTPYLGTSSGYAYPYVSAGGAYATKTATARDISTVSDTRPALGRQVAIPGVDAAMGDTLVVEQVSLMDIVPRTVLRLTWQNRGLVATQVALFLADTAQGMLSAQTLRSPPFTALFEPPPGTAFAGMTVVWPDGTLSTRIVPYQRRVR